MKLVLSKEKETWILAQAIKTTNPNATYEESMTTIIIEHSSIILNYRQIMKTLFDLKLASTRLMPTILDRDIFYKLKQHTKKHAKEVVAETEKLLIVR